MARAECLWCESGNLAEGRIQSTGRVYFKPGKAKFWALTDSLVEVKARVCVDCGYVDLYADTRKLKKLVKA
jgi:predicted nucleic-acid-binding Zn-ribbon protein